MEPETVTGATMVCLGGEAALMFETIANVNVLTQSMPSGSVSDIVPEVNIISYSLCLIRSLESAAPMPCTPIPLSPWIPGLPNILINGMPALGQLSMLPCFFGGVISITFPNNESVLIL